MPCDLALAVEVRQCLVRAGLRGEAGGGRRRRKRKALFKSRDPHLAGGEKNTMTYKMPNKKNKFEEDMIDMMKSNQSPAGSPPSLCFSFATPGELQQISCWSHCCFYVQG